jgi:PAS domain S-box-containing protein
MHRIGSSESPLERPDVGSESRARVTWPRTAASAVIPPLAAFIIQSYSFMWVSRWSLFYPAVFLSSWLGGFGSGIAATIMSTIAVWWYFLPPSGTLVKSDPMYVIAAGIFVLMGVLVSMLQGRLRRSHSQLESANGQFADAMRELAGSQRVLQAILDYSPNAIVIKDLEGRYFLINRGLERVIGMPAAMAKGKTDFDLFPRQVAQRFRNNDWIVRHTMTPLITEERPDPNDKWHVYLVNKFPLLQDDGTPFAICAIWSDISDLKRAEDALRLSANDLREAQRVAHVGSWSWNPRDGVARWSEELYQIFGRDPSRPPPRLLSHDSDVFIPESRERLIAAVDKLFREGIAFELDLELVRPDGSRRWVLVRGDAVRDHEGRLVEMNGTAQDVTHLHELQRMREEWTSVIAHDLKQPIGVITMAADFLPSLHHGQKNDKEQDFTRRIAGAARTLARMVDDLLDLSLLEADRLKLERRLVDPRTLVKESVERLSQVIGDRHVTVIEGPKLAPVFADPMRIGQVLGNLISNAVKYGAAGTEIVVRVERHDGDAEISVTNHGAGIPPEELPRIFNRFIRSKTTHGSGVPGLGLGLYISKGVIEAHGGRMWVESTPGETTTFHLTLPCRASVREAA